LDEEGAMAYQAARSGIEWGVYRAIINSSCTAPPPFTLPLTIPTTPVSTVNYSVAVTCTSTSVTEGTATNDVYRITATANNAATGNFAVERQLTATVSK
jgi:MSHA biogenesis protein MshP